MTLGQEIEKIRQQRNIPVWQLCVVLDILSEKEYCSIKTGRAQLSVYQKIMLIDFFNCPFERI